MESKKNRKPELGMSRLLLFLMIFLTSFMKDDTVMADGNTDKILIEERRMKLDT